MTADRFLPELFGLQGRVAVVTGATGVIGGILAHALGAAGAAVALVARRTGPLQQHTEVLRAAGIDAFAVPADVLATDQLHAARDRVLGRWGRVDMLVNAAGGNVPAATLDLGRDVDQLSEDALRQVIDLNLLGTWLPCQTFVPALLAGQPAEGVILNISSMAAERALTRVGAYGAAKAAVESLTRWLAVELARRHGPRVRVNALAPGFFLAQQNRDLLIKDDGTPTKRGHAILAHTPAGRFGEPADLAGTAVCLCSPAARFITGAVIPVDGGFSAFAGI